MARRLKGALAETNISGAEVARRLGVAKQKLSRRTTGQTPFDVDELDEICVAAGRHIRVRDDRHPRYPHRRRRRRRRGCWCPQ
ncbi:helix-turn-helix transcriptional regulator [Mycolicibacterium fortuitum]|nr:helix-turn-helix transcriptional regulator [Mycolicibacterium fortuitum]